jgi:hypothetical protein
MSTKYALCVKITCAPRGLPHRSVEQPQHDCEPQPQLEQLFADDAYNRIDSMKTSAFFDFMAA